MRQLLEIAEDARRAKYTVAKLGTNDKNRALLAIADALEARADEIIAANAADIENGRAAGLNDGLIDRLMLDKKRIAGIAEGCRQVAALPDPVGEVLWMRKRPNGLNIGQKRVPMGVIGIIYEARPNVTVDAAALCFKAGSACILRGGKEAFRSSMCLTKIMREALASCGLPENAINLVEDTSRETATQMMKLNGYLDVLIPRGGAGLIRSVVMNATVPVIETGTGNCHIYVDASADLEMAKNILVNAKCQRPSVCNAAESLLVHRDVAAKFLPMAAEGLVATMSPSTAARARPKSSATPSFRQPTRTTAANTSATRSPARSSTRLTRPSTTSTASTPATPNASSPVTTTLRSVFWRKWTRRRSMSTPPRALQTASSSASAQRSVFPLRSCTHAARWD